MVCNSNADQMFQPLYHCTTARVSNRRCPNVHRRPSSDAIALISVQLPSVSTAERAAPVSRSRFSPNQPNTIARFNLRKVWLSQSSRTSRTLCRLPSTNWATLAPDGSRQCRVPGFQTGRPSTNWATLAPDGSRQCRVPGFQTGRPAWNRVWAGNHARTPSSIEQSRTLPSQKYSSQAGSTSKPVGVQSLPARMGSQPLSTSLADAAHGSSPKYAASM